jgi:hypothetical protein
MADTQKANHVADDAIPDDVGLCRDEFTQIGPRQAPASKRKAYQAVACIDQPIR